MSRLQSAKVLQTGDKNASLSEKSVGKVSVLWPSSLVLVSTLHSQALWVKNWAFSVFFLNKNCQEGASLQHFCTLQSAHFVLRRLFICQQQFFALLYATLDARTLWQRYGLCNALRGTSNAPHGGACRLRIYERSCSKDEFVSVRSIRGSAFGGCLSGQVHHRQ